jgi:hypothetical protein
MGGVRNDPDRSSSRPATSSALPEILAQALGRRDLQVIAPGETARLAEQFQARWRAAARAGDAERIVETSTPNTLVVESLLGWLAARLPPRQALVLLASRGDEICGIRELTPLVLLRVHEIVRNSGESVHMMCPEGAFGLALESSGPQSAAAPGESAPSDGVSRSNGAQPTTPGGAHSLFTLFVWGAPR